jgi:predicted GNAT family N-acyltransferase/RimJ/RimL family protein N-acetyltransferase
MSGSIVRVEVSSDPGLLEQAARLRNVVFVGEQGVDPALEFDGRDGEAAHVVLCDEGLPFGQQVIGTARIFDAGETAVVGRMAVAAEARGGGLGRQVMDVAERWAAEQGLAWVELHAQQQVTGFYERLGYAGVGDPYEEAGIPHLTMRKDLLPGLRPVRDADAGAIETLIGGIWSEYPGVVLDVDGEEPWMRAPASAYGERGELWVMPVPGADGLLASVGWKPHPEGAELKSLYVSAAARRAGLGAQLVHFVERRVGGAGRLVVWSDSRFIDSHRLYARLGYVLTGGVRELGDRSATVELEFRTPS